MKSIKSIFLFGLVTFFSVSSLAGGPWLVKKNKGLLQFQASPALYGYTSMFTGTPIADAQGVNRVTYYSDFSVYGEYGLTDKWNLIAQVPLKFVKAGELTDQTYFSEVLPSDQIFGFGNVELDLKYALLDSKYKAAISLNTAWNTAVRNEASGLATGYDANAFGITAHFGRGWDRHYGFAEVGYQHYTNGYSGILEVSIEHGWSVGKYMNFALAYNSRHSFQNGTKDDSRFSQTGLYPDNQEWIVVNAKLNYERDNGWGANFSVPLAPVYLKKVGFAGAFSLGVYKKFK